MLEWDITNSEVDKYLFGRTISKSNDKEDGLEWTLPLFLDVIVCATVDRCLLRSRSS